MGSLIDEIGKRYGYLTVLEKVKKENDTRAYYKCRCDCGNLAIISGYSLRKGTQSCGCKRHEKHHEFNMFLIGSKYGNFTIIKPHEYKNNKYIWLCRCDCGREVPVEETNLKSGKSTKCIECAKISRGIKLAERCVHIGDKFGMLTVLEKVQSPNVNRTDAFYLCQCDCGMKKVIHGKSMRNGSTQSCGCNKQSHGEKYITDVLQKYNISFIQQQKFEGLVGKRDNKLRFDFAIYHDDTLLFLIEYDGLQHFKEVPFYNQTLQERQHYDDMKTQHCINNNIPLLRIKYTDFKNIESIIIKYIQTNFNNILQINRIP